MFVIKKLSVYLFEIVELMPYHNDVSTDVFVDVTNDLLYTRLSLVKK